ncbi:MAG: hypothetical protein CO113_09520 [Elusimicrobia bacterium CG_4_9_14_3_um_filter_62_55]|nr:MAG: hypothetical protein COX66_17165 [Elusimicrobia bacterium CG_4_10_14_0_2_um_filter_63_34]PJB25253.1 MAG: hypothetical protein CO113_09520 [Elusimicrobia bacterium CG_4_9_14_3_um_filter_62_55]
MGGLPDHSRMSSHSPAIALLAAGLLFAASASSSAEEVEIHKSGKPWGSADAYRVGEDFYLPAKTAARLYGGQLYWYAVRGEVRISFRGRQLVLTKDSTSALVDGRSAALKLPMIVRAGNAFIPIDFLCAKEFSAIVGVDSRFDAGVRRLVVDARSTVGPVRWFSYPESTRVVLELDERHRFQTVERGQSGLDLSVPNGTLDGPRRVDVSDGVVEYFQLEQESKLARLTLKAGPASSGYKIMELRNPHRVVIDFTRSRDMILEEKNRRIDYEAPPSPKQHQREEKRESRLAAAGVIPPVVSARAGRIRVMLDPGHGGKDGGAVGRRGTLEKDINLSAAKELALRLRENGNFDVRLTRDSDVFVKLGDRSKLANDFNAELFVSLHCNAADQRSLSGFEVYFLSERATDPEAERLAEFENSVLAMEGEDVVQDEAAQVLYAMAKNEFINHAAEMAGLMTREISKKVDLRNRGVKQAAFLVLRGANQPAVLVEMAFLSNSRDEAKLVSEKYRGNIVDGIYEGILDYVKRTRHSEVAQ